MSRHVLSIIWGALWIWPETARTVHPLGSSTILTWEGTYCPSSGELYDFDLRRHVLSIIWGALSFWPEDTYCPSSGELYEFNRRGHVLSIICGRDAEYMIFTVHHLSSLILTRMSIIWGAIWFWHEQARTVHHLGACTLTVDHTAERTRTVVMRSYMILTWEGTYCPSSGELYDFDSRGHVLSIIWVAMRFWPEKARTVYHLRSSMTLIVEGTYCPSSGELYDFDRRGQLLFIIWGALWFWHEKARTVHHLGSYMILT